MSGSVSPSLIIYPSGLNFFPILKPQINEKGTTLIIEASPRKIAEKLQ
jgi:hypothetical protein